MHTGKVLRKALIVLLTICEALFGLSQIALALPAEEKTENAIVIGFIDSGIAPYHLDEAHILPGKNYVFSSADTVDRIGHGTKTAGMVLGSSDGSVKGTFPEALAVPLVVVDRYPSGVISNGGTQALVSAIYDAVDVFGCRIINISLCTTQESEELRAAVGYACAKGVILVCAAGNDGASETLYFPAHYDSVITVGSSAGEGIADFSQTRDVDFFYEGKNVPVVSYRRNGKTSTDSGTSYSCAAVAGICAAILAEDPSRTVEDVRAILSGACVEGTGKILKEFTHRNGAFRDTVGHWAEKEIEYCSAEGIISGNGDGTFLPDDTMTRAMFTTILWNMAGRPQSREPAQFSDVTDDAWYAGAVDWSLETGLVGGVTSDEFAPEGLITREQVCVLLRRYAALEGRELQGEAQVLFTDEESISDWARADVALCAAAGIIKGYPDRTFAPGGEITRAECCGIIYNYRTAASGT